MGKWVFIFLFLILLVPTFSSAPVTVRLNVTNDLSLVNGPIPIVKLESWNITNVNSSDYWDNLDTPSDIPGSEFWYNMTGASGYNYTLATYNQYGQFWYNQTGIIDPNSTLLTLSNITDYYNFTLATYNQYGKWWYNQTTAGSEFSYNHTSITNESLVTNYGKWWYNMTSSTTNQRRLIFIGVDGMSWTRYSNMLEDGVLSNFTRLMEVTGANYSANITGHSVTTTAPGNAELHTGLNETWTGVTDNTCNNPVPDGNTTFEKIEGQDSSIVTGSVYGKTTCYVPDGVLGNALTDIDWFFNITQYDNSQWIDGGAEYVYSVNVSTKAVEFLDVYQNHSFYLTVYYGAPDASGHAHGDNSSQYNSSLIDVDDALGIILDELVALGIENETQIIVSADHGWNFNTTNHDHSNGSIVLPLITNNASMIEEVGDLREQCDIAPTILEYFGLPVSSYQDILDNGCDSLMSRPASFNYNHTSIVNESIVTNYGRWWYNQTGEYNYNQTLILNNTYGDFFYNQTAAVVETDPRWNANFTNMQVDCPTGNYSYGIHPNGSLKCRSSGGGGTGDFSFTDFFDSYILNSSVFNESWSSTYNATYALWAYNQSMMLNQTYGDFWYNYTGTFILNPNSTTLTTANITDWYNYSLATYNQYGQWWYNMTDSYVLNPNSTLLTLANITDYYNFSLATENQYKQFWYNMSDVEDITVWLYNQTSAASTYNYNHTQVANQSLVDNYGRWWYNHTAAAGNYNYNETVAIVEMYNATWTSTYNATYDTFAYNQSTASAVMNYTNLAFLNNSQTFTDNQTLGSGAAIKEHRVDKSYMKWEDGTLIIVGIR